MPPLEPKLYPPRIWFAARVYLKEARSRLDEFQKSMEDMISAGPLSLDGYHVLPRLGELHVTRLHLWRAIRTALGAPAQWVDGAPDQGIGYALIRDASTRKAVKHAALPWLYSAGDTRTPRANPYGTHGQGPAEWNASLLYGFLEEQDATGNGRDAMERVRENTEHLFHLTVDVMYDVYWEFVKNDVYGMSIEYFDPCIDTNEPNDLVDFGLVDTEEEAEQLLMMPVEDRWAELEERIDAINRDNSHFSHFDQLWEWMEEDTV